MKLLNLINKKVHIIGINGIGMSALAVYLKKNKIDVSGSDIASNSNTKILEKNGIPVQIGHKPSNVRGKDMIFYSTAIKDNPEIDAAKKSNIPFYNRSKLLQLICNDKFTIVVTGSHGKTTTTSMLGHLLVCSGLSPTIITGGIMNNFGQNIYLTDSNYVVVEADESDGTVFKLNPKILIYLNVDKEHLDYYKSFTKLKSKIKTYIKKVSKNSLVILNNDDIFLQKLSNISKNIITYGKSTKSNYYYKIDKLTEKDSKFNFFQQNEKIAKIKSPLLGEHNVQNLCAILAVIKHLNIQISNKDVMNFKGIQRRMNTLGKIKNSILVDDYAHHCKLYKNKDFFLIIEPHRFSRLNDLYSDYIKILKNIKNLIILKTYSAGESFEKNMKDSKNLVNDLNVLSNNKVSYIDTYDELFALLDTLVDAKNSKIIVAAGAGSISAQMRFFYESRKY
jgi:UDP-N-acetylmuramate--alanine ligase